MMSKLVENILEHMALLPEGTPISAKELLHFGARPAVDQALSRLARRGQLVRAGRGLYVLPVTTRFGARPPSVEQMIAAIAVAKGETIASHGAAAANALGLTKQVPMRAVYLTSGRSRHLKLGEQDVELRHAPAWQLVLADRPAGEVVRALAWLGQSEANNTLDHLRQRLPVSALREIAETRHRLPTWMAEQISRLAMNV